MRPVLGFFAGLTFGIGLILSGMANPAKVLNFLDIFGAWDPSLAFVMGGASVTAFIGYRLEMPPPSGRDSTCRTTPPSTPRC